MILEQVTSKCIKRIKIYIIKIMKDAADANLRARVRMSTVIYSS